MSALRTRPSQKVKQSRTYFHFNPQVYALKFKATPGTDNKKNSTLLRGKFFLAN